MADQYPWTVRAALWFVNTVDGVVATVLGTAQTVGERQDTTVAKPPLAGFRRAASVGAKGAKWSVIAVIAVGTLIMIGTMIFLPKAKPAVPARLHAAGARQTPTIATPSTTAGADVIASRCRTGAYRRFPEIEKAECAGRPSQPSATTGDAK
jgi:hypothetical protein